MEGVNMNLKKATTVLLLCTFAFLVIVLTGCNYTNEYLNQIDYKMVTDKINNKDTFILYVGNKSCSHCKDFEPKLVDVINQYKVTVYKLDTATMTNDEYNEFIGMVGQPGTPQVLFFYDGSETGIANRINGDVDKDRIISKLKTNGYIKD
jgi:predicted bacteriocin transport accessory protein